MNINRIKFYVLVTFLLVLAPPVSMLATQTEVTFTSNNKQISSITSKILIKDKLTAITNNKSVEMLIAEYYDEIELLFHHDMVLTEEEEIQGIHEIYQGELAIRNGYINNRKNSSGLMTRIFMISGGTPFASTKWNDRTGNTLYTPESKSFHLVRHGHAALISNRDQYVIEATTTATSGAEVFHWSYDNIWKKGQFTKVYELYPLFMTTGKQWSVNYALRQVGKPYAITKGMGWIPCSDERSWYCSKLVYMAYRFGGQYDLFANTRTVGEIHSSGYVVRPKAIFLSRNMGVYQYIGANDVGTYK